MHHHPASQPRADFLRRLQRLKIVSLASIPAAPIFRLAACSAIALAAVSAPLYAQDNATGTITGRILNAETQQYLSKARVTVEGTNIETLTDDSGEYTLRNVPAGAAKIQVSYAGQTTLTQTVTVEPGKQTTQGFTFNAPAESDGPLVLNEFVVESQRFRSSQEIANNEERNSVSIKNVISTESLGYIPDGNVGNFVQYMAGIDVSGGSLYENPNDIYSVSVRGFGAEHTGITIDGMSVGSAQGSSLSRSTGMDLMSINNATRIEILKVATPDMPQESPGGAINLVTRSAFEFTRPEIRFAAAITFNTVEPNIFEKYPGPDNKERFHSYPSVQVSANIPVSKTLGFSVSAATDSKHSFNSRSQMTGYLIGGPVTTVNSEGQRISYSNPAATQVTINDEPFASFKNSGNLKIDWKPISALKLTGNVQYSDYEGLNTSRRLRFSTGNTLRDWSQTYTLGAANGSIDQEILDQRDKKGYSLSYYLKGNYAKGPFTVDLAYSKSTSKSDYLAESNGHFAGLALSTPGRRVELKGLDKGEVDDIGVYNTTTGEEFKYWDLSNWNNISSVTARFGEINSEDTKTDYKADLRYNLDFMPVPTSIKVGFARNIKEVYKDGTGTGGRAQYITPGGLRSTDVLDPINYTPSGRWGLRGNQQYVSVYKLYEIYQANPAAFDYNYMSGTTNYKAENYNTIITTNRGVTETTDSKYVMLENKLFSNRLSFIVGGRQSDKKREGLQPYFDPEFAFQKNPDGTKYIDSIYVNGVPISGANVNYRPSGLPNGAITTATSGIYVNDTALHARLIAAGITPITSTSQLYLAPNGTAGNQNSNYDLAVRRGSTKYLRAEQKNKFTPQVQAAYDITNSLKLQVAWSQQTKLPNIENTAAGNPGLITSGNTFGIDTADIDTRVPGAYGGEGTIRTANPALQPEKSEKWDVVLSYFNKSGGKFSVSYFFQDITNLHVTNTVYGDDGDFDTILQSYGLDPDSYRYYAIETTVNGAAKANRTGWEADVRQSLDILGRWGKGFDVFATYSHRPEAARDIEDGLVNGLNNTQVLKQGWRSKIRTRDKYTGGIAYTASRFSARAKMVYTEPGLTRRDEYIWIDPVTRQTNGSNPLAGYIPVQIYNHLDANLKLDLEFRYRMTRRYTAFASVSDVLNSTLQGNARYDVLTGYEGDVMRWEGKTLRGLQINVGVSGAF